MRNVNLTGGQKTKAPARRSGAQAPTEGGAVMSKPKELVKKRWRAQKQSWELDYFEGGRRYRPLYATEGEALTAQVEIQDRLEQAMPRPVDYRGCERLPQKPAIQSTERDC